MSTRSMTCGDSPDANTFKISPSPISLGIFVPRRSSSSFSITSFASSHQDSLSPRAALPSVYRSCLQCSQTAGGPSSYLSDDELLVQSYHNEPEVDGIPEMELSTEDMINMIRAQAERACELGQRPYCGWQQQTQVEGKTCKPARLAGKDAISPRTGKATDNDSKRKSNGKN
jgi:hypothetical protein